MSSQQTQLGALMGRMKDEGYSFRSQKNWDGTRDVHALLSKRGAPLYATLLPTTVVWADLTGEGTNGSKLPNGGEIDAKGAKYTLTVQQGGEALASLVPEDASRAALAATQTEQFGYFQAMLVEFWEWVWDHAASDESVAAVKADGEKQVRGVIAMTRKVSPADVPLDDPDVQTLAKQNFVDSAVSPFGVSKTGEVTLKATQKVFLKTGERRPPPRVTDVESKQRNVDGDDDQPYVMRGMLVQPRVRFVAWAFAGRHGVRADLVRVAVLREGVMAGSGTKRKREDDDCSAFRLRGPEH